MKRYYEVRKGRFSGVTKKELKELLHKDSFYSLHYINWIEVNWKDLSEKACDFLRRSIKVGMLIELTKSPYYGTLYGKQPHKKVKSWVPEINISRDLNNIAYHIATQFHTNVRRIHASDQSKILWGEGASYEVIQGYYKGKYPNKCFMNAGAFHKGPRIFVENYLRNIVYERNLTYNDIKRYRNGEIFVNLPDDAFINGTVWAEKVHGNLYRLYNEKDKFVCFTARLFDDVEQKYYWEHGKTISEIKLEYQRKLVRERVRQDNEKIERAVRLGIRLIKKLPVTYQDARNFGFCKAGIDQFRDRYGLNNRNKTMISKLINTNDCSARRLAENMIRKVFIDRMAKKENVGRIFG